MSENLKVTLILVAGFVVAIGTSYLLALAHEPQSYWVWHDILKVLP